MSGERPAVVRAPRGGRGRVRAEASAAHFQRALAALRAYLADHGHAHPPTRLVVDGLELGRWVSSQRSRYRAGTIRIEQVAALEALPGWSWGRTQQSRFDEGLAHLRTYLAEHGSAAVGGDHTTADGFALGAWAKRRRQSEVDGELRPEWAATLQALPGWYWTRTGTGRFAWEPGAARLHAWVAEHGTAVVPDDTVYNGSPLSTWIHAVRRRRIQGTLTATQLAELDALPGFTWGVLDTRFAQGLALLREHHEATGSASPNQFLIHPSGFTLGAWTSRVRTLYRAGTLAPQRVTALEAVPGWQWNPMAEQWAVRLLLVRACALTHGGLHAIPRDTRIDDIGVNAWITRQRARARAGHLSTHETGQLESIPGWQQHGPGRR